MRQALVWLAGIGLTVFLLGAPVLALEAPAYTRMLSARYSLASEAGLTPQQVQETAEKVRAFVVAGTGRLPAEVAGRPGFDAAAVSHLADVQYVLSAARVLTIGLGMALMAALVWALVTRRFRDVGSVLVIGGTGVLLVMMLAAAAATIDFYTFFSAFHGLFFRAGTWTFPYDSLLIRLFPEGFWMAAGATWAACSAGAGLLAAAVGGIVLRRASHTNT